MNTQAYGVCAVKMRVKPNLLQVFDCGCALIFNEYNPYEHMLGRYTYIM